MNDLAAILAQFPRCNLIHRPTPLEFLPRLSEALGGAKIYIKRDDCTGVSMGGNKTRKLEFVVGEALAEGADMLITTGGIQSNHARQTAGFAAKLGLGCELVLQPVFDPPPAEYVNSGNVLLDRLLGATVHMPEPSTGEDKEDNRDSIEKMLSDPRMSKAADAARAAGHKPYIVALGASTPVGALGYVESALEIVEQSAELGVKIHTAIVASGSGATQAGLLAGFRALGADMAVLGIGVSGASQDGRRKIVKKLAQETAQLLGRDDAFMDDEILVDGDFVGEDYGYFDDDVIEAVATIARTEAIIIDPVYTGKAFAGLMALIKQGKFTKDENVLFVHTGGMPGLFAYSEQFARSPVLA